MNELQAQLDEVNAQIAEEQAKGAQKDSDVLAGLEQKQQVILMKIDDAKAQEEQQAAQQVRIQAQVEKVDSIVLPYDFNDILDNSQANSMIIEVVKEFQRKAYEDHNAEIQTLTDAHKEDLRAVQERELQLQRQNGELQKTIDDAETQAHEEAIEITRLHAQIAQLQLDKQDADAKRNAAVKQLEEAQAEITQLKSWNDDLRAQAAQGVRKAIDVVDISPTDKLAQMVKETNEQKANRALARWSEIMPEVVSPPLSEGAATFLNEHTQADNSPAELVSPKNIVVPQEGQVEDFRTDEATIPTALQVVDGNSPLEVAGKTIEERVIELERAVFGKAQVEVA